MPGPFDTTTRYLVETYPADWLSFLGFEPDGPIEVIDATQSRLEAITDAEILERHAQRLVTASSWSELLAEQG